MKWTFTVGGRVTSHLTLGPDGTLYFGADDGKVYAIQTGSPGPGNSPWPMFHHDWCHTGRVGYLPPSPYKAVSPLINLLLGDQ